MILNNSNLRLQSACTIGCAGLRRQRYPTMRHRMTVNVETVVDFAEGIHAKIAPTCFHPKDRRWDLAVRRPWRLYARDQLASHGPTADARSLMVYCGRSIVPT